MSSNTGAQPPGGQDGQPPQGGQPPQSGQPPQAEQGGSNELLKMWTQYIGILFAIGGAGIGFFFIISDAIDEQMLELDGGDEFAELALLFGELIILIPFIIILFTAPFIGSLLPDRVNVPEQELFKIAGASVAVGAAVLIILATILSSTTFDDASVDFGGLIINTLVVAVVAAGLAAGGAWAKINQYPR